MVQKGSLQRSRQLLHDVIFEIQNASEAMNWFLSYDRLSDLLELRKEEVLRKVYQFKAGKPQMTLSGGFHEVDGDLLIDFLSWNLELDEVAEEFLRAGIFFSERPLYELRESYKELVQKTIANHKLDRELLLLLVAATIDFDDAVDSYLMDKFEIDFFVRRSIQQFIEIHEIRPEFGAEEFLYGYLHSLIPTKILNFRDITREFRERTYYDIFGNFREKKQKKKKVKPTVSDEMFELLAFFDLEPGASLTDVKKKYKELVKKYHPDVNKKGEEMTKRIIAKYNRLVLLLNG